MWPFGTRSALMLSLNTRIKERKCAYRPDREEDGKITIRLRHSEQSWGVSKSAGEKAVMPCQPQQRLTIC